MTVWELCGCKQSFDRLIATYTCLQPLHYHRKMNGRSATVSDNDMTVACYYITGPDKGMAVAGYRTTITGFCTMKCSHCSQNQHTTTCKCNHSRCDLNDNTRAMSKSLLISPACIVALAVVSQAWLRTGPGIVSHPRWGWPVIKLTPDTWGGSFFEILLSPVNIIGHLKVAINLA